MDKKSLRTFWISISGILLVTYIMNMPLPGPPIDQRTHPLAIKLTETFPELKNIGEGPDRPTVSWGIEDIGGKAVAIFRVSNVDAQDRQDQILHYLETHVGTEPISRIDLIFYWKDEHQGRHRRTESVERK